VPVEEPSTASKADIRGEVLRGFCVSPKSGKRRFILLLQAGAECA
jgi:hypothetical protein